MIPSRAAARLEALDLAGSRVPHERAHNLAAIDKLLRGEPFYTFGIRAVEAALAGGRLDAATVLAQVAALTGCPDDPAYRHGPGFIDPQRTLAGLRRLAETLAGACRQQARLAFGTGHPGSLLGFWGPLAAWAGAHGAQVVQGTPGQPVGPGTWLDYVAGVGTLSDGASLVHSHLGRPGELVLAAAGVDWLLGDHGWAAAAINAGVPCVAVMDTNDPGLAVAHALGVAGLLVLPMGDNSPNAALAEVAEWVICRARGEAGPLDEGTKGH